MINRGVTESISQCEVFDEFFLFSELVCTRFLLSEPGSNEAFTLAGSLCKRMEEFFSSFFKSWEAAELEAFLVWYPDSINVLERHALESFNGFRVLGSQ